MRVKINDNRVNDTSECEVFNYMRKVDSVTETGTITAIRGTLPIKSISFRNIIEFSEERKEQLKEQAKRLHIIKENGGRNNEI